MTDLGELADGVAAVVDQVRDGRPLAFFGYSMGAMLAYEVARRLEDRDVVLRALFLPAARAGYRAAETYRWSPGRRLRCPVTVLAGDADPMTPVTDAEAWRLHTSGDTTTTVWPGGHFFLDEHLSGINRLVRAGLGALAA